MTTTMERTLIAEIFASNSVQDVGIVQAEDFEDPLSKALFLGALESWRLHGRVDLVVAMASAGDLEDWGGKGAVFDMMNTIPVTGNIEVHAETVHNDAVVRRVAGEIKALGQGVGSQTLAETINKLKAASERIEKIANIKKEAPLRIINGTRIMEQITPVDWTIEHLLIGPGRPTLIAGYGYSGKTVFAQYLATCVSSGSRLFGMHFVKQGEVLHLDYEQGDHATRSRYQRLTRGASADADAIRQNLSAGIFPALYLNSAGFEAALEEACKGKTMCVIDSLAAACPGVDENSTEVRKHIDKLTRVSERTGCAMVLIHHSGKSSKDKSTDQRQAPRGSSAILDACGTVFIMNSPGKGQPIRITLAKASASSSGSQDRDFTLQYVDTPDGGLAVEAAGVPEGSAQGEVDDAKGMIATYLRSRQGCVATRAMIQTHTRLARHVLAGVLDEMVQMDVLVYEPSTGRGIQPRYRLIEV